MVILGNIGIGVEKWNREKRVSEVCVYKDVIIVVILILFCWGVLGNSVVYIKGVFFLRVREFGYLFIRFFFIIGGGLFLELLIFKVIYSLEFGLRVFL